MANTTATPAQFKLDALAAILPAGISTLKAALYLTSASLGIDTTAYSATGEVSGSGYTAGGVAVTAANAPVLSGTTACWTPSTSIDFGTVTLATAFDAVLIYDTARSNKAVAVRNIGSQTCTATRLYLDMPTNDAANALVRA